MQFVCCQNGFAHYKWADECIARTHMPPSVDGPLMWSQAAAAGSAARDSACPLGAAAAPLRCYPRAQLSVVSSWFTLIFLASSLRISPPLSCYMICFFRQLIHLLASNLLPSLAAHVALSWSGIVPFSEGFYTLNFCVSFSLTLFSHLAICYRVCAYSYINVNYVALQPINLQFKLNFNLIIYSFLGSRLTNINLNPNAFLTPSPFPPPTTLIPNFRKV